MSWIYLDSQVVNALEGLAALAFSAVSAYSLRLIRAHVSAKNLVLAEAIIAKAVKAAQQLGAGKLTGAAKFQLAEQRIITELARFGITLTPEEIQTGIEAAVTDLKAAGGALVSDAPPALPTAAQTQAAAAAALRAVADQIDATAPTPAANVTVNVATPATDAPADPLTAPASA